MWAVSSRAVLVWPVISLALLACGSDPAPGSAGPEDAEPYLGLTVPAHGFQLRSLGAEIGPGEEREYCEVARLPGAPTDEYYVSLIELGNGAPSHHLGLALAPRESPAAAELE